MTDILQTIGVIGGVGGAAFVSFKKPWYGNIIWVVANCAWMTYAFLTWNLYQLVLFGIYLILSLIGTWAYRPRKEEKKIEGKPSSKDRELPSFKYTAMDACGREEKGTIQSKNKREANADLKEQGLFPTSIEKVKN